MQPRRFPQIRGINRPYTALPSHQNHHCPPLLFAHTESRARSASWKICKSVSISDLSWSFLLLHTIIVFHTSWLYLQSLIDIFAWLTVIWNKYRDGDTVKVSPESNQKEQHQTTMVTHCAVFFHECSSLLSSTERIWTTMAQHPLSKLGFSLHQPQQWGSATFPTILFH